MCSGEPAASPSSSCALADHSETWRQLPDGLHDVSDGEALHHLVRCDRWCVNRHDLRHLCQLTVEAIENGWVVPSAEDPFCQDDVTVARRG